MLTITANSFGMKTNLEKKIKIIGDAYSALKNDSKIMHLPMSFPTKEDNEALSTNDLKEDKQIYSILMNFDKKTEKTTSIVIAHGNALKKDFKDYYPQEMTFFTREDLKDPKLSEYMKAITEKMWLLTPLGQAKRRANKK